MQDGAKSFVQFAAFIVPGSLIAAAFTGSLAPIVAIGIGLFFVLQFCNALDANSNKDVKKKK